MGRFRILTMLLAFAYASTVQGADWSTLDVYQRSISKREFERLIATVFCPSQELDRFVSVSNDSVQIYRDTARPECALYTLYFSPAETRGVGPKFPLKSLRIAVDPGHIGGAWSRMEQRFFIRDNDRPVQEGVLNLITAKLIADRLTSAGASVFLTRSGLDPVTKKRPEDFMTEALQWAAALPEWIDYPRIEREGAIAAAAQQRAEQLFYRTAEILARSQLVNDQIKPDLTLCVHFNAVDWGNCQELSDDNRLLFFVHGNYLADEIADEQQRLRLFQKLLSRAYQIEIPLAEAIATRFSKATGLPPAVYPPGGVAARVTANPYIYSRNLAANRLFNGPVVYLEPYYMNSRAVYDRLQLGDYEGTRAIGNQTLPSIFREYADSVVDGIIDFYGRQ